MEFHLRLNRIQRTSSTSRHLYRIIRQITLPISLTCFRSTAPTVICADDRDGRLQWRLPATGIMKIKKHSHGGSSNEWQQNKSSLSASHPQPSQHYEFTSQRDDTRSKKRLSKSKSVQYTLSHPGTYLWIDPRTSQPSQHLTRNYSTAKISSPPSRGGTHITHIVRQQMANWANNSLQDPFGIDCLKCPVNHFKQWVNLFRYLESTCYASREPAGQDTGIV
jgi:hypothetical protein